MNKKLEIPKSVLAPAEKELIRPERTEEERRLIDEANKKIREAHYREALAYLHAKDFIAF